jgi:hypothetical protein
MATETRFPTGNSATAARNQWASATGGNKWDDVDESSADDATTYIKAVDTNLTQHFTYSAFVLSGMTSINKVTVFFRSQRTAAGALNCRAALRSTSAATTYSGANQAQTTSWAEYSEVWTVNPRTGVAWADAADVNDMFEFGVTNNATAAGEECDVTQVRIEVDYNVAASGMVGPLIGGRLVGSGDLIGGRLVQ